MSIMKKLFSFGSNRNSQKLHSSAKRFRPQLEPLEDRHLLSVSSLLDSAIPGTLAQSESHTEMEFQVDTQNGSASVVGIRIDATSAGFNPAAVSIYNESGTKISGNAVKYTNANYGGTTSSLLLVSLEPGNYTIRVAGDNGTYGSFVCDVFLPGDIDHDGTVSYGEYKLTDAVFLSSLGYLNTVTISALEKLGYASGDIKARDEIDIDKDGKIATFEMEAVIANYYAGKVTASMVSDSDGPEITAQLVEDDGASATDRITSKPAVSGSLTDLSAISTFQASFDGTDWADITIDNDGRFTLDNDFLKTLADSPVAANGDVVDGQYTLTLKATDQYDNESTYTFYYVVIANNTAPTATDGTFTTGEKTTLSDSLAALVSDVDAGDVFAFTAETVTSTQGISVTITADGTFSYAPGDTFANLNDGEIEEDEFTYTVTDAMGATATATVKITITGVNDAPVAAAITETTDQDTNKTIDVIAEATDIDNDLTELVIDSVTEPKTTAGDVLGEVEIENGKLVFSPGDDFKDLHEGESIVVTFDYTIKDLGGLTSTKTVTMTVTGKYDTPVANDDAANVGAHDAATEIDVLANDTIVDHDSVVELVSVTQPTKGVVTVDNGVVKFDPNGDFNSLKAGETETVTFTYTVKNSLEDDKTSTATVTVTITGVNTPPTVVDYNGGSISETATLEIPLDTLLATASDVNGDTLTVASAATTTSGVTVKIENGKVVYDPGTAFQYLAAGASATDTFTFVVSDGNATTSATVTVTITGVNDPLSVADQTVTVTSTSTNDPVASSPIQVTDADANDAYRFEIVGTPTGGPSGGTMPTITIDANTGVIYVSKANMPTLTADGEEYVVTVKVTNANDPTDTDTATIKIKVIENQPPVAVDVTVDNVGEKDTTATEVPITGVTDPEGNTFEFLPALNNATFTVDGQAQTVPTGYIATLSADGTFSFNPNGAFNMIPAGKTGTLTLTYQVQDSEFGGIDTGTITITIIGANDAPVASNTTGTVAKDATVTIDPVYTDVDLGDTAVAEIVSQPDKGTVTINSSGQMVYNPNGAFNELNVGQTGTATFTYRVKDASGAYSEEKTVTVTVTGKNSAHTVADQTMTVTSNITDAIITVGKIQITDIDGANGGYSYNITNVDGTGPTFDIDADGNVTVTKAGLPTTGTFVLTVKVSDNDHEATATITINVVEKEPPVTPSTPLELTVAEDATAAVTGTITGITHDAEYVFDTTVTALTFTIDGTSYTIPADFIASVNATTGEVSFNPNGKFDLIPEGKSGVLTLQYTVRDKQYGVSSTGTIQVTITGVNNAPTSAGTIPTQTTDQNTSLPIDVLPYFTDPDTGDLLSIQSPTVSGGGSVSVSDGKIVFNPGDDFKHLPAGQTANVVISFVVKDGATTTQTVSGTVTVTVTGTNDAPVANNDSGTVTDKNTAASGINVLANDTDPDDGETSSLVIGWVGRDSQGQTVVAGQAATINFTEGDSVTVNANGTITYNPGTRYSANGSGTDATATFEYQAKDAQGELSNKATVTVLVQGANDPPKVEKQIEDAWKDMGETIVIDLVNDGYFSGQNLTFTIEKGDDPAEMIEYTLVGSVLTITFTDNYYSQYDRDLVPIVVTATNSDGASVSQTFHAATKPTTTAQIKVVTVDVADSIENGRTTSFDTITTSDGNYQVGDQFYIEIWVEDLANSVLWDGFSYGIASVSNALSFDGTVVKIVVEDIELFAQFAVEETPVGYELDSENAYIEKIGGGITRTGVGLEGNIFRSARILVEVIAEGDPNFKILSDSETSTTRFQLSRQTDNVGDRLILHDNQVDVWVQTVTCVLATTPLLGEDRPEVVADGGVYVRVVTETTNTASDGTVSAIPDNVDWLHEWQEHWVEIWVKASDLMYFTEAGCTLNYNTDYFTATEVELSPAFSGNSNPVINDELGQVTGIGGDATRLVKSDGYILLARVKFESIGTDNVSFDEVSFAHDLEISLSDVLVRSSTNESFSRVGKSPQTELWAVPYDVDDDGAVTVSDFAYFANAFRQSSTNNTLSVSVYDYDKDGYVSLNDFAYFANVFGYDISRDSGKEIKFPESFTQRYVGKTLDADSAATVNKIIDAANKAWQTELGLDSAVSIQIVVQDLGGIGDGNTLATAQITAVDENGLPISGIIVLDDDAAGMGWYSQLAEPVANGRYDLYTTLLHEMGHIYGFNTNYDAFSEVVGEFVSQLDSTMMHAADSNDLMYATLATGVRKYISEFNVSIINSAYEAAQSDASLGFSSAVSSSTAALTAGNETQSSAQAAFAEQENGSFVATLNVPATAFLPATANIVDADTAMQLHAMGLAVGMPTNMLQKEENLATFTFEQIYAEDRSLFDLSDDDLATFHQSQEVDESELALIDLSLDLDA